MKHFDEFEFSKWLDEKLAFSIRKHYPSEVYSSKQIEEFILEEIQEAVDELTPMELVCYLGEYLTTERYTKAELEAVHMLTGGKK